MKRNFKKILLVEDDNIMVVISNKLMKIVGFADEVVSVINGHEAREYLNNSTSPGAAPEMPDLILLDLHMNMMTGWEFLDWYNNWTSNLQHYPPVYILSSTISEEDSRKAKNYKQVEGFITKPITVENLDKMSRSHLN